MAISTSLRNKLIAAASDGAMLIATIFLGGKDGVEGRVYVPYKDVAGVWTVCDDITVLEWCKESIIQTESVTRCYGTCSAG